MNEESGPLITEVVSRPDAREFLHAIEDTIAFMTPTQLEGAYLYIRKRNAIAFSFDREWNAFIGFTRGYNQPEDRIQIRRGGNVLSLVRKKLKTRSYIVRGHRVFITKERAFLVNDDSNEENLCAWIWLDDNDPVIETLRLLSSAKLRY